MESLFSQFKFSRFQFLLKASDALCLPEYKGSTLRGAFGHAFKKVVCVTKEKVCDSCLLKGKCVYSYVFETPPSSDTSKMRKYPYAPHPFVITPLLEEKRIYREGQSLSFELTLIGKSIDFLPYFIYTFDELGRIGIGKGRGKYTLENVGQRTKVKGEREEKEGERTKVKGGREQDGDDQKTRVKGERNNNISEGLKVKGERDENQGDRIKEKGEGWETIYSGKDKILHSNLKPMCIDDLLALHLKLSTSHQSSGLSPLTLFFVTPTRLKFDGKLSPHLEFHVLIRNLLRRLSLLSYFHCGEELDIDFRGLIEQSKNVKAREEKLRWIDWERYSNRQETKMKMGGFVGSVTFEGDLELFLPFLLLGEYVHVGKGTSFGLGKYEIENPGEGPKDEEKK